MLAALSSSLAVNSVPVGPTLQLAVDTLCRVEETVGGAIPRGLRQALLGCDDDASAAVGSRLNPRKDHDTVGKTGSSSITADSAHAVIQACRDLVHTTPKQPLKAVPEAGPEPRAADRDDDELVVLPPADGETRALLLSIDALCGGQMCDASCPSASQLVSALPDEAELLSMLDEVRLLPLFSEAASTVGRPGAGTMLLGGGDSDALNECCVHVRTAWLSLRQLALECGGASLVEAVPPLRGVFAMHPR